MALLQLLLLIHLGDARCIPGHPNHFLVCRRWWGDPWLANALFSSFDFTLLLYHEMQYFVFDDRLVS